MTALSLPAGTVRFTHRRPPRGVPVAGVVSADANDGVLLRRRWPKLEYRLRYDPRMTAGQFPHETVEPQPASEALDLGVRAQPIIHTPPGRP